ncbi:hypothetical protein AAP_03301 [Ascosphaera apis ARSEF 7405]|uniref:Uncharacterized protein n=1 Tax=Ascosphaera apis ARSEF 7405 TaxID=392613 RepID=A0A167YPD7_9EURO|nr:hypothetical protein AAP_03301 [Ascosphaera apis ARSEF 7405]
MGRKRYYITESAVITKTPELPSSVTIRIKEMFNIRTLDIAVEDDWAKEILEKTWGNDFTLTRDIRASGFVDKFSPNNTYAILSHASGKTPMSPCVKCSDPSIRNFGKAPFVDCRLNAIRKTFGSASQKKDKGLL